MSVPAAVAKRCQEYGYRQGCIGTFQFNIEAAAFIEQFSNFLQGWNLLTSACIQTPQVGKAGSHHIALAISRSLQRVIMDNQQLSFDSVITEYAVDTQSNHTLYFARLIDGVNVHFEATAMGFVYQFFVYQISR